MNKQKQQEVTAKPKQVRFNTPAKRARLIEELLQAVMAKLKEQEAKPTIADLIRLLQLKDEAEERMPREVTVHWLEPAEK
jgi:hypothetical protein